MRSRISGVATLCKRFAAVLRRCDVETFLNMGRLYPEIAPLEKRINMHIDLLRRDEFKVMECVSDIVKCVLVLPETSRLLTTISGSNHSLITLRKPISVALIRTLQSRSSDMSQHSITTLTCLRLL